jgi:hypothetical protein
MGHYCATDEQIPELAIEVSSALPPAAGQAIRRNLPKIRHWNHESHVKASQLPPARALLATSIGRRPV